MKKVVLLAWWFFWQFSGSTDITGPFESQARCEKIRAEFTAAAVGAASLPCTPDEIGQ